LTPVSEAQESCVLWLKNHFELYGDKMPNRDEIHLYVMTKRTIYDQYKREKESEGSKICAESKFNELWQAIYPTCLARDYTDIPGKCETCAYIDQKRRFSTSSQVQEHLKQAFLLHRGGMFMAERREYVDRLFL